jgi:hypothetical protein
MQMSSIALFLQKGNFLTMNSLDLHALIFRIDSVLEMETKST